MHTVLMTFTSYNIFKIIFLKHLVHFFRTTCSLFIALLFIYYGSPWKHYYQIYQTMCLVCLVTVFVPPPNAYHRELVTFPKTELVIPFFRYVVSTSAANLCTGYTNLMCHNPLACNCSNNHNKIIIIAASFSGPMCLLLKRIVSL